MNRWDELTQAVDAVLVSELPIGLKQAIDDALAGGWTRQEVLRVVRRTAGGRTPIVLSVEAYLGVE